VVNPITFFYAGNHTDYSGKKVKINKRQLAEAVAHFNRSGQRLPLVVGHPKNNDDSYGEATELEITDDGKVKAVAFSNLNATFKKIVNTGELPKISVKLRLPGHPKNSYEGIEFDHLGFFGRSDVALDKLPLAQFSAPNKYEAQFMTKTIEELQEELEQYKAREASFKARAIASPLVDSLVRSGAVASTDRDGLIEIFADLDSEAEFSAPGHKTEYKNRADFLAMVIGKKAIPLGQQSAPTEGEFAKSKGDDSESDDDSDDSNKKMHSKIMAYAKANKCSYAAAMSKVGKE